CANAVPIRGVAASYRAPVRICRRLRVGSDIAETSSEMILQRKLDLAQLAGGTNSPKTRRGGRVLCAPACARAAPCRVVGSIEHLHTELEGMLFRDPEILHRREIDIPHARTDQVIAAAVSELSRDGVGEGLADEVEIRGRVGCDRIDPGAIEAIAVGH